MKRLSPLSLFIFVSSCIAATNLGPHIVHESRDIENTEWARKNRVGPDVWLPVRIALKQNERAMENAHDWLMDVSHPESPNYGQHWSLERVIETFQPSDETVQAVTQWLTETQLIERHRITHSDNKAWLAFDIPATAAEKLFKTKYYEYSHIASGRIEISCDQYYIPEALQKHIDYVKPGLKGIQISQEVPKRSLKQAPNSIPGFGRYTFNPPKNPLSLAICNHVTTPACIRALYQFEPHNPSATVSPNNTMGIYEAGNYLVQEDLDLWFNTFAPHIPKGTHPTLDLVDSGNATDGKHVESILDFSIAYSIIYPQNTILYQVNDLWYNEQLANSTGQSSFNTFLDAIDGSYCTYSAYNETGDDPKIDPIYPDPHGNATTGYHGKLMCGVYKPTNVVSLSYGGNETGPIGDFPAFYEKRQCNEFLKLALQGVTMIFASGDSGVPCLSTKRGVVFGAGTPTNCPYVTSVGGTKIARGNSVYEPEVAVYYGYAPNFNTYSSGGGFSNIYPRPKYQEKALSNYFANYAPPYPYYENGDYNHSTGMYNRNGRGFPDVAANGLHLPIYNNSLYSTGGGGTSASAPIFASLINRINEERIRHGKGSVGFVNPALYEHPEVLNDITEGHNAACGNGYGPGFYAVPGWDPVTGLGTPNYPKMLELFLSLP